MLVITNAAAGGSARADAALAVLRSAGDVDVVATGTAQDCDAAVAGPVPGRWSSAAGTAACTRWWRRCTGPAGWTCRSG